MGFLGTRLATALVVAVGLAYAQEVECGAGSPLFVENAGQFPAEVRYQARLGNRTVWITDSAIWLQTLEAGGDAGTQRVRNVRVRFEGARKGSRVEAFGLCQTRYSYFLGSDPEQWHRGVAVWNGVRLHDLYDGADLELTARDGELHWRWVVPSGDARLIPADESLQVEGAEGGVKGVAMPDSVDGAGNPLGGGRPAKGGSRGPLLLSNDVIYAARFGGGENDLAPALAVDSNGAAYVGGITVSTDFPTTPGGIVTGLAPSNAFVAKLNPSGNALVYVAVLGGSSSDAIWSVAVDTAGNLVAIGQTQSDNFPILLGAFQGVKAGGTNNFDGFAIKLSANGTSLLYSTYLGGTGQDYPFLVELDSSGNAYISGEVRSSDFPTTGGAYQTTSDANSGFPDAFLTKLNPAGSALVYSTYLGVANASDIASGLTVDRSGNAYLAGYTSAGSAFPTTAGAFQRNGGGGTYDAFVVKLNASGSALVYSTLLGGSNDDQATAIAVTASGEAVVTGITRSGNYPITAGVYQQVLRSTSDGFVTRLNSSGTGLLYSTLLGGTGGVTRPSGIVLDAGNNPYIAGITQATGFPVTGNAAQSTLAGFRDGFIALLKSNGSQLAYATYFGGPDLRPGGVLGDELNAVARLGESIYIAGHTYGNSVPVTTGSLQSGDNDSLNIFAARIDVPNPGTASFQVWFDGNEDRKQQSFEQSLPGLRVFLDRNSNGTRESGEPFAISDAGGRASLGVPAGPVRLCIEVDPATVLVTTGRCQSPTVPPGGTINVLFGLKNAPVGITSLSPSSLTVKANEKATLNFNWVTPGRWRDLAFLHFRIVDENEETLLWLRLEETTNLLQVFNTASGRFGPAFSPGSPNRLETSNATVYLADTAVIGSGPTGPSVTLRIALSLKPNTAGGRYTILALATDDFGNVQGFEPIGTIAVTK